MTNVEIQNALNEQYTLILNLDNQLKSYDYIGVKIATGRATCEEYQDKIDQMIIWANAKSDALEEIARLEAIIPEEVTLDEIEK